MFSLNRLACVAGVLAVSSMSALGFAADKKVKIGFSMDTLKEERWQKDRDLFVKTAEKMGAEVLVQAANGDASRQQSQAENLLTQGVDVLVVVPYNGVTAAAIVEAAHKRGKKVISYDRLIKNSDVDLYVSFDNMEVGRIQAKYVSEKVPKGNYVLIGGAPTDNNAKMFRDGQMEVLNPLIKSGVIKVVADQWAKDWQANEALKHTENALTKSKNDIQAVVASNDGTAGGVISALKQKKLDGVVQVSGQDADLAACQRIAEGTQAMTVYKPVSLIATAAAEAAVAMAKNETVKTATQLVNNGKKDVPSLLLKPQLVTKENLVSTVVKDGWQKYDDVYKNVPAASRPKMN
jgi:D-xylose transport system substrate-binding protein